MLNKTAGLQLLFLGKPEVYHDQKVVTFNTRKTLALLIYLAVEQGKHSRDKITALFWPESDADRSRGVLRTTLTYLRTALPKTTPTQTTPNLRVENDALSFSLTPACYLDLQPIQVAYNLARQPIADKANHILQLQAAAEAYRGDFLEGFSLSNCPDFDNWASMQRESWHQRMNLIFKQLATLQAEQSDFNAAIETLNHWLKHDSIEEAAHQQLIELYLAMGDRAGTFRAYENYRTILQRELGADPSPQIKAVMQKLQKLSSPAKPTIPPAIDNQPKIDSVATKTHILVVEDNEDQRKLLNTYLRYTGYEVTTVMSGQAALRLLQTQTYELIITDAMMPGMTGYELVQAVRLSDKFNRLPILMLTSLSSPEDALQAFRDGVDDFVTKPIELQKLKDKVTNLLQARSESTTTYADNKPPFNDLAVSSGLPALDKALGGSWPIGSNILLIGPFGSGKSTFARHFLVEGLLKNESAILVNLDENSTNVRHQLNMLSAGNLAHYESQNCFRLVEAEQWGYLIPSQEDNKTGLNDLAQSIIEASVSIGQDAIQQKGGRRIIDSVSSLFVHFDLATVHRFLMQLTRTAPSYGQVSTLFLLEEGSVDDHVLNNLKYLMDGVFECQPAKIPQIRIASLKKQAFDSSWQPLQFF